ncbi:hypothetical protein [Virgisporangium ochraceum]|uniref:hypothetical protein n=1 Tax=Virgisporangium ochraceum TaxID=65505 RepID=UPI001944EF89|nr:hypothetical protein [Virgisporangium ochraceum]
MHVDVRRPPDGGAVVLFRMLTYAEEDRVKEIGVARERRLDPKLDFTVVAEKRRPRQQHPRADRRRAPVLSTAFSGRSYTAYLRSAHIWETVRMLQRQISEGLGVLADLGECGLSFRRPVNVSGRIGGRITGEALRKALERVYSRLHLAYQVLGLCPCVYALHAFSPTCNSSSRPEID